MPRSQQVSSIPGRIRDDPKSSFFSSILEREGEAPAEPRLGSHFTARHVPPILAEPMSSFKSLTALQPISSAGKKLALRCFAALRA
jgi:hypothetical protein